MTTTITTSSAKVAAARKEQQEDQEQRDQGIPFWLLQASLKPDEVISLSPPPPRPPLPLPVPSLLPIPAAAATTVKTAGSSATVSKTESNLLLQVIAEQRSIIASLTASNEALKASAAEAEGKLKEALDELDAAKKREVDQTDRFAKDLQAIEVKYLKQQEDLLERFILSTPISKPLTITSEERLVETNEEVSLRREKRHESTLELRYDAVVPSEPHRKTDRFGGDSVPHSYPRKLTSPTPTIGMLPTSTTSSSTFSTGKVMVAHGSPSSASSEYIRHHTPSPTRLRPSSSSLYSTSASLGKTMMNTASDSVDAADGDINRRDHLGTSHRLPSSNSYGYVSTSSSYLPVMHRRGDEVGVAAKGSGTTSITNQYDGRLYFSSAETASRVNHLMSKIYGATPQTAQKNR